MVRPGELMEIDSTPLDVAVRLPNGVVRRVELTGMIDVATRTVTAGVVRPTTKSVDASLLLARTVTPELMRPGWADALRMSRSVLPYRSMRSVDERLADAAAAPVIVPEVIVCDQATVFISNNFRSSCRQLGIDLQPAPPGDPTKKPHIERMMSTVGTQFAQYLACYLGSSPERRGLRAEEQGTPWSLPEIQHLFDEWLILWQNRPHDGLRDPLAPGRTFTPNEKYAALVQAAGYVPVALGATDYIELLPAEWRAINHYGVRIGHRIYDGKELGPYRRRKSGVEAKRGLWEVHRDPYDISRIWVRNHLDGGWMTVFWKLLRGTPAPFGELAWNHELARLRAEGKDPTEQKIADAVQELLSRADAGPQDAGTRRTTPRDARVVGRTLAVGPSLPPEPVPTLSPQQTEADETFDDTSDENLDDVLAEVIPLGVFDARKEARKLW
ncbi:Mu transposase C-terminal domain-containing protein [Nocardia sp. 2YAB30]|uniref:Mu transposase C-terminal domain-containing protein n=1 Tax=Nocardia sp. 2YAB30 TaxID=3233022 RepID=UPI003F953B4A